MRKAGAVDGEGVVRVAVWKSGHPIADMVASSMALGLNSSLWNAGSINDRECIRDIDVHIGYGILRGTEQVFKEAERLGKHWLNVDRGYFGASHYDGYYRVNLRGTQHTGPIQDWMLDDTRWRALGMPLAPWRGFDKTKPVLYCPPTVHTCNFFNASGSAPNQEMIDSGGIELRVKGIDSGPIDFSKYNYVHTFNSSVGWLALASGIPCVSNAHHSLVGSYFANIPLDKLSDSQHAYRHKLFAAMVNLQLTLKEMSDGKLWSLVEKLLQYDTST